MKEKSSENLEQKVSQLISRIEKVRAPSDFAFKLRARIATEKQKRAERKILLARFSYAFSALVFALSVVTVVYVLKSRDVELASHREVSTFRESALPPKEIKKETNEYEAESKAFSNRAKREVEPEESPDAPEEELGEAEEQVITFANVGTNKIASKVLSKTDESEYKKKTSQFSRSEAVSALKAVGLSQGEVTIATQEEAKISVSELFRQIGIEGSFQENGGFKVKSLKPNSLAEKSGIKPDDLILAIGEKKLENQEIYFNVLEIKELKVKRKSEELNITLKP